MGVDKAGKKSSRFNFIRKSASRTTDDSTIQELEASVDGIEGNSTPALEGAQGEEARDLEDEPNTQDETNMQDEINAQDETNTQAGSPRQDPVPIVTEPPQDESLRQDSLSIVETESPQEEQKCNPCLHL
ncbi:uncharacterized protein BJ212DRAFT_1307230 [Suillus subaureus]|uniref:Uncharacterized protein n=1 Tax=Suillus subaureus TaxID=48587 RepID=A0A9P7DHK4_9AGAM|nr:uncharacterized protein BJ212DRAFT_1307230 [Suillus subaureus]KAG1793028.1 hypothetical protein BJ212DRAFT_1307230 [Suillus subaureus]